MKPKLQSYSRWLVVVVFAMAMAWVESAVVFYLRSIINRIEPYQAYPLPLIGGFGKAELVREAATLIMLLTVGILAGRTWRSRLGYAAIAFGIWDIFYYVFLKVLCDWPHSLWDWDILFLLPLPWWGPVLAPVSIAVLMILWGTMVSTWPKEAVSGWKPWCLNFAGAGLALYQFMADSIRVADRGIDVLRKTLPAAFNWPLFCVALLLMAAPILQLLMRLRWRRPAAMPLDYERWIAYFKQNRQRRPEPDWTVLPALRVDVLKPLLRSLEQFQLGDGGGPASLIARDAERFRGSCPQMRTVVDNWFAEEREHSRLLGCAVKSLGGKQIASHWSFTAFCTCRRIFGVGFELQVLLLTEITSTAYYRLLRRHSPIPALASMCALILRDEAGHIAFHRDRLVSAGRGSTSLKNLFWVIQFHVCGFAAATMLWVNHRKCCIRLGASTREFYHEVRLELARFCRAFEKKENTLLRKALAQHPSKAVPEATYPEAVLQQ